MRLRVATAVSGRGSNLAALLDALGPTAPADVVLVFSNRAEAGGLELAQKRGIPTYVLQDTADPREWLDVLTRTGVDMIVLAGFLKRVPPEVVSAYRNKIINIHPALLPRHGGPGMYGMHVHRSVLAAGEPESGATVHVVNEEYDRGPILGQGRVPVLPGDTPETLASRVLEVEHRLLPAAVLAAARAGRPVPFAIDHESAVPPRRRHP